MFKRIIALSLTFVIITATVLTASAASLSVLPRVYRPDMFASVAYHGGQKYIALDIVINDITEPTGLLSIGFNVLFDGDALDPLWKTDTELNGDGVMAGKYNPPQMITKWPTFDFTLGGNTYTLPAAEGLCKPYAKTGKGILNVNLVVNIDFITEGVVDDGAMALRLYFTPTAGFIAGDAYTFTIDGQYDETVPQYVTTDGSNNHSPMVQRVLGYGGKASVVLGYADCGAFDLSADGVAAGVAHDGDKGLLWVKEGTTADLLSTAFSAPKAVGTSGKYLTVSDGTETLTVAVKGDVNTDGVLSTADYVLLMSAIKEKSSLDEVQIKIADTNGNGKLSSSDALEYLRLFGKQ